MNTASKWSKDLFAGALMVLVGLASVGGGLRLHIGTLMHMGPGFFPVAVGVVLTLVGIAIALTGMRDGGPAIAAIQPDWRGWGCIVASMVAFIVLAAYGGLVPATFAVVFIAALGDRKNNLRQSLWLSLGMIAVSVIVFRWGLKLQLPLFGWR